MRPVKSKRLTFKILVCEDLGYCCPYAFFKVHKRTGLIAERLGFTDRAVRYQKMAFKDGKMICQNAKKCLKGRLF